MTFDDAFMWLLGVEGSYSNNVYDPGGATKWGITEAVARSFGYTGGMKDYPLEQAKEVYKIMYWGSLKIESLPECIRYDIFDAAVNSGVTEAIRWLQHVCSVEEDGVLGPKTLDAAHKMDPQKLRAGFNGRRLQFMTDLPQWSTFGKGWARRIARNLML
ncbi:MAG: glycosyl hydrolase 108 family protein [bacterium]|jgi:lysozyme family protein